jgi:radical SAM enzyme (TIGR01210 family)
MCDLWAHTLDRRVPTGAISSQIRYALERLPPSLQIKLYNAGSFFDPQAIPTRDYPGIAASLRGFDRVIVESHPAFLSGTRSERCLRFRDLLPGQLEVAVGLETVHPGVLEKLNKRMTLDSFQRAAEFLQRQRIDLRAFILLRPPFLSEVEGVEWACRSLDFAARCGATVCTIIPVRGGNGAMESLGAAFVPPSLQSLEQAVEHGLSLNCFRVFADLWGIERLFDCDCSPERAARLRRLNQTQSISGSVVCGCEDKTTWERGAVKNLWWQPKKPLVSDRPPFSKGGLQGGKRP